MSHSGTGPLARGDNRVCRELASASFNHPEIATDGLRPDQSAHDVHITVLTGDTVRGMAVSRERRRVRGGEREASLRPRVERRVCGIHLRWRCLRFLHNKSETSSSLPISDRNGRQDKNTTRTCTSAEAPDCCGLLVPISCPGPCCSGPIDLGTLFMGEELLGGLAAAGRWSGAVLITPCRLLRELLRELLGVVFEGPPLPPPPLPPPPPCVVPEPACAPSR